MLQIKTWKRRYKSKPSPIYFVFEGKNDTLLDKTFGYGKVLYPEGSVYEGNLFYFNKQFHKHGFGIQDFKNTKINCEQFGGPMGLLVDKFVGNFNYLETNWIYGDGIFYFTDINCNPKAYIKGFFHCLNKIDSYQGIFNEEILLPGYSIDMEVEQVLHRTRYEYLLSKVEKLTKVDTVLLGDSWFELYEMPYKNGEIYGSFNEDTKLKSVINLGIGGSTYLEWLGKIDSLLGNIEFSKVIINLGFNDIHSLGLNVNLDYILCNLKKLESKIRCINPECEIYYLGVSPSCSYQFLNKKLELNKLVKKHCHDNLKNHFISTEEIFITQNEYNCDFNKMFIDNDGNHLNEYGYSKWSKLFLNIL